MKISFKGFGAQTKLKKQIQGLFEKAMDCYTEKFHNSCPKVLVVEWNPRMRSCAGKAWCRKNQIGLNSRLLNNNEKEIEDTFVHELAHIITHILWPRIGVMGKRVRSHGPEWQGVMMVLGKEPERCHALNAKPLKHNRRKFLATCRCSNPNHYVGARVRNKILKGSTYTCKSCRSKIELGEELMEGFQGVKK